MRFQRGNFGDKKVQENTKSESESKAEVLAAYVVANQCTVADAAEACGMSPHTAYKYSATPEFRKAKITRLIEHADAISADSIDAEREAVAALRGLLASPREDIVVSAAKGLLGQSGRAITLLERQLATANAADRAAKYDAIGDLLDGLLGSRENDN